MGNALQPRISTSRDVRAVLRGTAALACLAVLTALPVLALDTNLSISQYIHTSWIRGQVFPLPDIQALAQTPDGYLWLGTTEGLFRFDGIRFSQWQPPRGEKLPSDQIRLLRVARDGALWMGASTSVSRLERNHLLNYTARNGLPQGAVLALFEDHTGRVWVSVAGSKGSTLATIEQGAITVQPISDGARDCAVLALHEDRENNLWMGTNHALGRWSANGRLSRVNRNPVFISAIADDTAGNLFAADSVAHSLLRVARLEVQPVLRYAGPEPLLPRTLMRDRDGNIWLGTLGQGLFRFRDGRAERFTRRDGLSSNTIESILEDREGDLWIGTSNGLDRFRNPKAPRLTTLQGLASDIITAVCATHRGDIWIGTAGAGLNRVHGNEAKVDTIRAGLPNSTIMSLHDDGAGLWVGTTGGVAYFSGGRFVEVRSPNGAPLNRVFAMTSDADGSVWLLDQQEGLLRGEKGRVSAAAPGGIRIDPKNINQIHSDGHGGLWIGSVYGDLALVQGRTTSSYGAQNGVASGPINAIETGSDGTVWVGTGGGLSRLRNGRWTTWTHSHGLPERGVQGMVEDKAGSLWLSSGEGLLSVPMKALAVAPDGSPRALTGTAYGLSEGIRLPANRGMVNPRLTLSADGRLWVATEDGVAIIDPKRLAANAIPPPVLVEQVNVDGSNLPMEGPLVFRGRELRIDYTALSLVVPEKTKFRYKLENLDSAWQDAGTERTVLYRNLPPGSYRFLVTACNNDGVWNNSGAVLPFRVQTYFYQTWKFTALCVLALALAGWGLHHLRQRNLRTRFEAILQERARLTRELHDTLLQGFAGVVYQLEGACRQFDRAPAISRQKLERAIEQADDSLREARETLSFMRLSSIESSSLVEALSVAARKLTDETAIHFETSVVGDIRQLRYDLEANLYILAREAINNAVNHANPRLIKLDIIYSADRLQIAVTDDGRGFDPGAICEDKHHFGIPGMRERAHQIGAILTINSQIGRGTTITVDLPVRYPRQASASAVSA